MTKFNNSQIKSRIVLTISIFLLSGQFSMGKTPSEANNIFLSEAGKTVYSIIVSPDDPVANTAARELAKHLQQVTGADFPIVRPGKNHPAQVIAVGPDAAKTLLPDLDLAFSKLGNDGIVIKTSGKNLILTGASKAKRGTLYAVYEFLENQVGIRWWTSSESRIPANPSLSVPRTDIVYVPQFIYRDAFYKDMFNGVFAARCKCNGHAERIPPEYGGNCRILGWCHTFYQLLPPRKYFKAHPEWYSENNGKRTFSGGRAQLCLSNEEMRREFTKNAIKWLRKNPDAAMISISQNDACSIKNGCNCRECLKLAEKEGSPSGPLLKFVNRVAEDIEKEFPHVYIVTLAYQYTGKPPLTIRPRKNVIIRFCIPRKSFSQPLSENKTCSRKLEAWSAIAPRLFIWDYLACYGNFLQPFPNLKTLGPNIRYFAKNHAVAAFEQGDNGTSCGDFVQLRAWVTAHLLWNPQLDAQKLIREFMDGYYGKASKPLLAYLELIHGAAAKFDSGNIPGQGTPWLLPQDMIRANELFDRAESLTRDNPALSWRVRRARMPLTYTWLREYKILRFRAKTAGKQFCGPSVSDMSALCQKFLTTAEEFKLQQQKYTESLWVKDLIPELKIRFRSCPPKEVSTLADDDWFDVPMTNCRFWKMGKLVHWADDPAASSGRAVKMDGNHTEWAVQYVPPPLSPVRCYVVIRCDVKPGAASSGPAFTAGIYDNKNRRGTSISKTVALTADGKYHAYDLGVYYLKNGYVWVAPVNNPEVKALYIDRIFFVRDPDCEKYTAMYKQALQLQKAKKYAEAATIFAVILENISASGLPKNRVTSSYLHNLYWNRKYQEVVDFAEKTMANPHSDNSAKIICCWLACLSCRDLQKYADMEKWAVNLQSFSSPKERNYARGIIYQAMALKLQKKLKTAAALLSEEKIAAMPPSQQKHASKLAAGLKTK
ncbi:MAG: DUF4838 domain-containing protein [Victivallaceae bacterium]|nr:DUF4838 domain-containing protein [Victivallaceae bacterium]